MMTSPPRKVGQARPDIVRDGVRVIIVEVDEIQIIHPDESVPETDVYLPPPSPPRSRIPTVFVVVVFDVYRHHARMRTSQSRKVRQTTDCQRRHVEFPPVPHAIAVYVGAESQVGVTMIDLVQRYAVPVRPAGIVGI